jgi:hypothetical protein
MPFALARLAAFATALYAGLYGWSAVLTIGALTVFFAATGLAYGLLIARRSALHFQQTFGTTRRQLALPTDWTVLVLRDLVIGAALASLAFFAGRGVAALGLL